MRSIEWRQGDDDEEAGAIGAGSDEDEAGAIGVGSADDEEAGAIGAGSDDDEGAGAGAEDDGAAEELAAGGVGAGGAEPRLKMKIRPTMTTTATMMIIQVLRFIETSSVEIGGAMHDGLPLPRQSHRLA